MESFSRYEESHASEDVGLWASGPLAFMFHSTHEQSHVGHVMAFSLCIGHFTNNQYCSSSEKLTEFPDSIVTPIVILATLVVLISAVAYFLVKKKLQSRGFDFV